MSRVRNYPRSTITEVRFTSLSLLYIEGELSSGNVFGTIKSKPTKEWLTAATWKLVEERKTSDQREQIL